MTNLVKQIPAIQHHTQIPIDFNIIGNYQRFNHEPGRDYYFLNYQDTHLVIFGHRQSERGYFTTQCEFPLKVLPWVLMQLRRFELSESTGGMPSDKISELMAIDGEEIGVSCGPSIGGPDIHGYQIWNKSRKIHRLGSRSIQSFNMPTPWLDSGFRDFWKSMSDKFFPQGWV